MNMAVRITTDHNFRGYNYSTLASQRNNTPYSSFNITPSVQPQFVYSTPLKGLKTLFWGNFFLNNLYDRDNDFAILQDSPGGQERYFNLQSDISQGKLTFDPKTTKRYKERNGLQGYDGIFFGIYYEWNTNLGKWSVGTWIWNNLNRMGKYTWQEYFIWYSPPFAKWLNPTISFFLNSSFDSGGSSNTPMGITNGQDYISMDLSHKFSPGNDFTITPRFVMGYVQNNDNVSRRSGVSNVINSIRFGYKNMDLTFHVLYRPDPLLYDTSDQNKSDGKVINPSRQAGNNKFVYDELQKAYPKDIANYIGYEYSAQKFVKTIFYISMGYSMEF